VQQWWSSHKSFFAAIAVTAKSILAVQPSFAARILSCEFQDSLNSKDYTITRMEKLQ